MVRRGLCELVGLFLGFYFPLNGQISGRVVVAGVVPPKPASVMVDCGWRSWAGYSDKRGEFIAPLGRPNDGSVKCLIEATISGFTRGVVLLTDVPASDVIVTLYPLAKHDESTVSYLDLAAPLRARKQFEKAVRDVQARRWSNAETSLRKAIAAYPAYALAWNELGFVLENSGNLADASNAYSRAVSIDGRLFSAYARWAVIEAGKEQWDQVAATTDTAIKQNPFEWPNLFFYNAVANFNLGRLNEAEQSARRAIAVDTWKHLPRAHYILGRILAAKGDYHGAVEQMRKYLDLLPEAADAVRVRDEIRDTTSRIHPQP
jgi:tetratricopeptide (TPR) repeat protein